MIVLTAQERADETFMERVAIALEDGKQTEEAAILIARLEKRARDRKTMEPKQTTIKWRQ